MSGDPLALAEAAILLYFLGLNSAYLVLTGVACAALLRHRLRHGRHDPRRALVGEGQPPISILVPAFDEEETVVDTVASLLALSYREFEVVVVDDGSRDRTLARLTRAFALLPVADRRRRELPEGRVQRVYRSRRHPGLTVLAKERGGKSDALNAGINAARHPIFCTVDADSILDADALSRIARVFADDPRVVAAGGIIRVLNGARLAGGRVVAGGAPRRPLLLCQGLEYVRAFVAGRSSLASLDSLLIIAGAFGLFRRGAVVAAGGFSGDTVCEDMELVLRLHRRAFDEGRPRRVVFVPDPVCWTQVPSDWGSLARQRDRWQRGLIQSLWKHRRMLLSPRYGSVGLVAMPFYLLFEALGPLVELAGYLLMLALALSGHLEPELARLFFLFAVLYGMLLSLAALNLDNLLFRRFERTRDLAWMMLAPAIEFLGYRQFLAAVRSWATVTAFVRRHQWGRPRRRLEPERRVEAPEPALATRRRRDAGRLP